MTSGRVLLIVAPLALAVATFTGCGGNGASEGELARLRARVNALDHRLATLEAETRRARKNVSLARRVAKVEARASTLAKNDDAFYASVSELYFLTVCNGRAARHVPLGTPGALYTDDRYPGRIFATPAP